MLRINRLIDDDNLSEEEITHYFSKLLIKITEPPLIETTLVDEDLMIKLFTKNLKTPNMILKKDMLRELNQTAKTRIVEETLEEKNNILKNIFISCIINREHKTNNYNHQTQTTWEKIFKKLGAKEREKFKEAKELNFLGSKTLFKMAIGEPMWEEFLIFREKATLHD